MTLDDVIAFLIAEAMLDAAARDSVVPRRLVWHALVARTRLAERAERAGWVYR